MIDTTKLLRLHSDRQPQTSDSFATLAAAVSAAAPGKVTLFDDFLGDVLADPWSGAKGSDAQAVVPTITPATAGAVRLTCGDTVVVAESASSLTHGLNWKASQGDLVFEARVTPVSSVASVAYFIGFTDTLATTTLEEPATLSGTTITYVADNAVGFLFDTAATTDVLYGVGVKATAGVPFSLAAVGPAPVADTAMVLRIEVSVAGTAMYYVNGTVVGTVANAVSPTVALTPAIVVMARTTAVKSLDVDYLYVAANRA